MAKKKEPEAFACPVEKMGYVQKFRLYPAEKCTWMLCDYSKQSITTDGSLCPDKAIKIQSDTGINRALPWGTMIFPCDQPEVNAPKETE